MKKKNTFYQTGLSRILLTGALFTMLLAGCNKQESINNSPAKVTSMNEIKVPENFHWKMTGISTFLISGKERQIIEITTTDGSSLLHKSIIESGKTESVIALSLPTYIREVLINGQKVFLGPAILNVSIYSLKSILSSSNKAVDMDGSDDAVKVGHHAEFTPGTGDFTCEAWVNTSDKSPDPWARKIVSKGLDYGIYINPADGKVHGYINNISTLGSTTSIDDGNWHHVAFKRSGNNIKIYIDGAVERSDSDPAYAANLTSTADFKIGAMHEGASTNSHWHGKIDEVRCWNTARSSTEIHDNYDKKVPGGHSDLNGSWDCDEDIPVPGYIKDRTPHGHDGELENGCLPGTFPIPSLDGDGDGITDLLDDYPADPLRAFDNYFPALGEGTLAFEDLWPSKGDYDCNDLVMNYRFKTTTNASNKVVDITSTFIVRALGAQMDNGFGFQLPDAAAALFNDLQVSGYDLTNGLFTLNATTHLETGQTKPVIAVFSDAHNYMPGIANTVVGHTFYPEHSITVTMTVPANTYTAADFSLNTWNPFLVIDQERGREVHLVNYHPTDLANAAYLGTKDDASNPSLLFFYQTSNKLPWVLDFPEPFEYPVEYAPINEAYLHFVEWAESGGVIMTDWYKNTAAGYRNTEFIY